MIRKIAGEKSIQLMRGDITHVPVDAICNAANSQLAGGGGVDGAIHRAAGPALRRELDEILQTHGECPTGKAVATSAGSLPAKWVFHAVGPIYRGGEDGEAEALRSAYRACLDLAEEKGAEYVSFPSISTGVYGYPVEEAARIALNEVISALREEKRKLSRVVFVLFDDRTCAAYAEALRGIVP
ncbi:MAG TPA: O-acetyl-ADP-ribose deacetylase [Bryobacteraceae bacterium]|nr:O-acetyl-ADP-ribose deacetylase [Bryobacteraceae bacterium]